MIFATLIWLTIDALQLLELNNGLYSFIRSAKIILGASIFDIALVG